MMRGLRISVILCCAAALAARAQQLSVRLSQETIPPGGIAQIKVELTEPRPISTGRMAFEYDFLLFGLLEGVSLFSPAGDVSGAAVVRDNRLQARVVSPQGAFGTAPDYPMMTIALRVRPDAPLGRSSPFTLDLSSSFWRDLLGRPYVAEIKPGSVTVGGNLHIGNVIPGGGLQPAGAVIQVTGSGFRQDTRLQVEGVDLAAVRFVNSNLLEAVLGAPLDLHGRRFRVRNGDDQYEYFSYLRAAPVGASIRPLLAAVVPLFSSRVSTDAAISFPSGFMPGGSRYLAVALQNPGRDPVSVSLELLTPAGALSAAASANVPPASRLVRDATELFGVAAQPGASVRVAAAAAIQMLGLTVDESTGEVLPVAPTPSAARQPPVIHALVNSASQQAGGIAPGAIVSLYGLLPGPATPAGLRLTAAGLVDTELAGVRLWFDGVAAPLLYVSATQVNAVVPFELAGKASTNLEAEYLGTRSSAISIPVVPAAPGIFTMDGSGRGQSAALNEDGTLNGAGNPAPRGSIVVFYATGEGETRPPGVTGGVGGPLRAPVSPVIVEIGGERAALLYAGSAPEAIAGLLQVNARVPATVGPGAAVPVVLEIAGRRSQQAATIAVR